MKRLILALACVLACLPAQAKVHTMQVTIGAAATPVIAANANLYCKWVVFQNNNASDTMRIGDSNTSSSQGIKLVAGASFYQGAVSAGAGTNLNGWYVQGTQNDVIDIVYDDGQ